MSFLNNIFGKQGGKGFKVLSQNELISLITKTLQELNCNPSIEERNDVAHISFTFQAGYFQIQVFKNKPSIELAYINIYSTPLAHINDVRQVCNSLNINTDGERAVYSLDHKENSVVLHILHTLLLDEVNIKFVLERALTAAFYWQRALATKIEEQIAASKNAGVADTERDKHEDKREIFLLRELEMEVDSVAKNWREAKDSAITIGQLMTKLFGMPEIAPISLSIFTDEHQTITDPNQILNYIFSAAILDENSEAKCPKAILNLSFLSAETAETQRNIVFFIELKDTSPNTVYFHLTANLIPLSPAKLHPLKDITLKDRSFTVLIAHDKRTDKQLHDEFLYFWKEAKSKMESGKNADLSPEEEMIANVSDSALGFFLYRGKQLFLDKRFAEAALSLENGYKMLNHSYTQPSEDELGLINEVAYFLGICYLEMGQVEKAYFYLNSTIYQRIPKHLAAFVDCLMAMHDHRALQYIYAFLQEIQSQQAEQAPDDSLPPSLLRLQLFLLRKRTLIHIELKQWEQARQTLLYLKENDPENEPFVTENLQKVDFELEKLKSGGNIDYNQLLPPKDKNAGNSTEEGNEQDNVNN